MDAALLSRPVAFRPRVHARRPAPAPAAASRVPQRSLQGTGDARLAQSARADFRVFAAAKEEVKPDIPIIETAPEEATRWHFVIANADFMLNDVNNEHLPEVLRERRRYLLEVGKPINFFVVQNPSWLDALPDSKRVGRPSAAIICPDPVWITFIKLRMDRVLKGEIEGFLEDVTKSTGPVPVFPKPANWEAPYAKYAHGWWDMFTFNKK